MTPALLSMRKNKLSTDVYFAYIDGLSPELGLPRGFFPGVYKRVKWKPGRRVPPVFSAAVPQALRVSPSIVNMREKAPKPRQVL